MPYTPSVLGQSGRDAYVKWAAAVKQAGGVVTVAPHARSEPIVDIMTGAHIGGGQELTAAMYRTDFVFPHAPSTVLNPLFKELPDDWANNGEHVFYVAPPGVQGYADPITGGITKPQSVPGEPPPPKPQWYEDLLKYGKYALYGGGALIGGLILLNVVERLPRSRR